MKILVVEDDAITRLAVKSQLENPGAETPVGGRPHIVTAVGGRSEAEDALDREHFDYAFIDLKLGSDRNAGRDLLKHVVRNHPGTICIMMTSNRADEALEDCLRSGAAEYIIKPFEERIIHDIMRKAAVVQRIWHLNRALKLQAGKKGADPIWLTSKSPKMRQVLDLAKRLKNKKDIAVFISGESGVGKEVMARYLWTLEEDLTRVFVAVHTGALPSELVESELFGSKKGSFSGSTEDKIGKFDAADGGDIFLDEVATMPLETQVKLLRVLQQKEISPIGSGKAQPKKINVRVISATNEDIHALVAAKRFREDLLFRMKMATLEIPPLRERLEDLEDLVALFLRNRAMQHKKLSADAWELCRSHRWPGNIRELENAIMVASELSEGDEIKASDLRPHLQTESGSTSPVTSASKAPQAGLPFDLNEDGIRGNFNSLTQDFEQALIRYALEKTGSTVEAARLLGISRGSLNNRRKNWGWSQLD